MKSKKIHNPSEHGKRIERIRKLLHLTQKEFAERIGTTQSTVSNWESGRVRKVSSYWWDIINKELL